MAGKVNKSQKDKEYYQANKEKIKARAKAWKLSNKQRMRDTIDKWEIKNPDKVKKTKLEWKQKNIEAIRISNKKYRAINKEKRRVALQEWRNANPEKAREKSRIASRKRLSTPKGKLNSNISREIRASLVLGQKNKRHWEELVNFTVDQLKTHLEKLFQPGMTWNNYGSVWEIDHKIPLAVFNFDKPDHIDFKLCWSLKNLQPLGKTENRCKGAKLKKHFQPSLKISVG